MIIKHSVLLLVWFVGALLLASTAGSAAASDDPPERTSFQTHQPWGEWMDIGADVVMAYGIEPSLPHRLKSWTDHGYTPEVMTGVSWGEYQDYLYGRFDGKNHEDAAQQRKDGTKVSHGGDVYYMVPEEPFGRFLSVGVKRAIDAGARAIYLEEPEFWSFSGYSPAFKREWKAFYGEDWQDQESSPEARYRSGQLKYFLYKRALAQVFAFVKQYSKEIHRTVRCYVPTHSMLNYASWGIVSPESSLATLDGCDGYIAQTWTGTARTPNFYNGVKKERTFETAYLEYGQMHNLARATGRRMIYLADPIEDNPDHSWADYKTNYEQTLVASLLWPDVTHFEVVPWPERVFHGRYPTKDHTQRKPGEAVEKEPIPPAYATQLMACFETLKHMDQKDVEWHAAAHGVGVLVSDTLMFHRGGPDDPGDDLSHIYGQLLPLLKTGIAVEPVQLENASLPNYLKPYKVLFLTYNGQKPLDPKPHEALANWVKAGGVLVFLGKPDPFSKIRAWWNAGENHFASPEEDLFQYLHIAPDAPTDAWIAADKGWVYRASAAPQSIAEDPAALKTFNALSNEAFAKSGVDVKPSNALWLRRGPYVVGAVMDESVSTEPLHLHGRFVDIFGADLPVLVDPTFKPGTRFLLVDLSRLGAKPQIAAAAAAIRELKTTDEGMTFRATGPTDVEAAIRIQVPSEPKVTGADASGQAVAVSTTWDTDSKTVLLRFPNHLGGVKISVGL